MGKEAKKNFFNEYFEGDKTIWGIFIFMLVVSALTMYSASSQLTHKADSIFSTVWSHILFLVGGFVIAFLVHRINLSFISRFSRLGYFISVLLMIITPFIGVTRNSATRWLRLGPIEFQPSEIAKIFIVLCLAKILSRYQRGEEGKTPDNNLWAALLILGIPACIIMLDNLSTFILTCFTGFLMMYFSRMSYKLLGKTLLVLTLIGGLAASALFLIPDEEVNSGVAENTIRTEQTVQPIKKKGVFHRALTWRNRIQRFWVDDSQPHDENYKIKDSKIQEDNAKIAIANGKWFGKGIGNSVQRDIIPLAYADFIFAIVAEEAGLFALGIIIIYLILLWRVGVLVKKHCDSIEMALTVFGLVSMMTLQAFFNIFIAVGLFPVSGLPLPLFSRGGTSILITSIYFGIILCVSRESMKNETKN